MRYMSWTLPEDSFLLRTLLLLESASHLAICIEPVDNIIPLTIAYVLSSYIHIHAKMYIEIMKEASLIKAMQLLGKG